ncbi:unnamed protein product [Adineta steineri]|uniref:Protein flightless-1 n=1 Tax=Adineta steineri TaxID=433720 RepID=A0A814CV32_9BILA|nr:unnamed protein product [Adineta steineri]CAF0983310.1 unnamed protein product [Adineta steineri]CAF0996174.1 unnamed protein product [Adineta steineri]CAF1037083.1 unnamed protein product [Adineta steineri]CAF1181983.1 unnamed protein product [Adineta steineri]
MAPSVLLPYIYGLDLSKNAFGNVQQFPVPIQEMCNLRWLELNRTNVSRLPEFIGNLKSLEKLSLAHNDLRDVPLCLNDLTSLRSLSLRDNHVSNTQISARLFDIPDLSILDLSHNDLQAFPKDIENAKGLIVLNLSSNHIEQIPNHVFVSLFELVHLNLSDNKIDTLPAQMRRLTSLQVLILNNNPLVTAQLRQLSSMHSLETLHLSNTKRTLNNVPAILEQLPNLSDLDLSANDLPAVPDVVYKLKALKRLNLNDNQIIELTGQSDGWPQLEILHICRNKLKSLPQQLMRCTKLRRLYLNSNQINLHGLPRGIFNLEQLEVFSAADNNLETIPDALCRLGSLKVLNLNKNRLLTLPEAIHFLQLKELDVSDNPDFVMPPKPKECQKGSGPAFYNIDFSLANQLKLAGQVAPEQPVANTDMQQKRAARIRRLNKPEQRNPVGSGGSSETVLRGMRETAKRKHALDSNMMNNGHYNDDEEIAGRRWDEQIERPQLNYTEFFDEAVGHIAGITCWEIENFLPKQLERQLNGTFYTGDCYIVLHSMVELSGTMDWNIYFWIGKDATLDKQACAAMHAVNLRNMLGASCRTQREEQTDESEEFLALFNNHLRVIDGARTETGFWVVRDIEHPTRFYRASGTQKLHVELVAVSATSLDPRYVLFLDIGPKIYIWTGKKCHNMTKAKTRLFVEKINKSERKGLSELIQINQGDETDAFWKELGGKPANYQLVNSVPDDFIPSRSILYKVDLGQEFIELPQVELEPGGALKKELLHTRNIYILDCYTELFVWIGKKSARLVRMAATRLAVELLAMIKRPAHASITKTLEGVETQVFKSKFDAWDDVLAVDFTRTAENVTRKGADMKKILQENEMKTNLTALFKNRPPWQSRTAAQEALEDWNIFLLQPFSMFVYENKKFVKLPDDERGQFYSQDSYLFVARYLLPSEDESIDTSELEDEIKDSDTERIVYFWQGRSANNTAWLSFNYTFKQELIDVLGDFEIVQLIQQQENQRFMAHFNRKFVIHNGKRRTTAQRIQMPIQRLTHTQMYHIRWCYSTIMTRCIQVEATSANLCSEFCYIVTVPLDSGDIIGIVYVWVGNNVHPDDALLVQEIANEMYNDTYTIQVINEGNEPENFFWVGLGDRLAYDTTADYMRYMRLFKCSNENGYFVVTEKYADFCQDDLLDDDCMLLDTGTYVFLWKGPTASIIEVKFAAKSAELYIQHLRTREPDRPRKLRLTVKNSEPIEFRKCFHAWSKHKNPPRDLEKQNAFSLGQQQQQKQAPKKPLATNIFV